MRDEKIKSVYDVIIAGAGPVGLFLACELALAKCSVLIIEKAESPESPLKKMPFGVRGLSAPSIEALYRRDLLNDLELHKHIKSPHQNSDEGSRRQVGHFAGIPIISGDVDTAQWRYRLPSSTATSLISEMHELETVLTRRAESLGVEILRGHALTNFQQTENEVAVQARRSPSESPSDFSFRARWLVGCDGARSVVRKIGGFEFAGTEPEFTGYTTQLEIADPEKLKSGRIATPNGMYFQSQPGYVMMQDFDGGAFHSSEKPLTREHVQEVLRRLSNTDVTITTMHAATTWTDRARQATRYRNGRLLLAGDAAHIHSPLGGQGLNLGLGDAMNLGWKLAATIHDQALDGLIDTYQTERHPVGTEVLNWSRAQVAAMKPDESGRALNAIFRDLMNTRDGATYFAGRVWGVSQHYDLGSDDPLVGYSVPNFEFADGSTVGELLREGKAILLDFTGAAALKSLVNDYADQIKIVESAAKDRCGLNTLLIRPDGVVAWTSKDKLNEDSLRQGLAWWFKRG